MRCCLILLVINVIVSCNKEKNDQIVFKPTDHVINSLGSKMRFVIKAPDEKVYNFLSDAALFHCEGNLCKEFLVSLSEINKLAQNLSDTLVFKWKPMTAVSPYPEDQVELLIYGGNNEATGAYNDFMCSIGKGNLARSVLKELSKSVTGESKAAFDEIIAGVK